MGGLFSFTNPMYTNVMVSTSCLLLLFTNCGKDGLGSFFNIQNCEDVCSEWERCTNTSED